AVTAYPSLYEGFGFPVVEAMACGSPVLTSNTTALPEVAGQAAILVDPMSVEEIAEGLWLILSSPEKQAELRRLGLEQVKKFRWIDTAAKTLDVYSQAIA